MIAASGSSVLWGLGREQELGVPGASGLTAYRAVLPLEGDVLGKEQDSAAVNQSGFIEPGIAGGKDGKIVWGMPLTTGMMLEFLEHFLGSAEKTAPEAGVNSYLFAPTRTGVDTSFYGLLSREPVARTWIYGLKFAKLTLDIGDNTEIPIKMEGAATHGTRMGVAVADPDNTGTYTKGPYLRGPLRDPAAGDVYLKATRVTGGLQFKLEQTTGSPTFAEAAVDVALDETGRAVWQNLQFGGADLGFWVENKDPLEAIFPGDSTDHADLAVGDVFRFRAPGTWPNPAIATLSGHQRFTSAHWTIRIRKAGSSDAWTALRCRKGTVELDWPLSLERGNSSRYPYALLRDGLLRPTLKIERALVNAFFISGAEASQRFEVELAFVGRQLGTAHREGLTFHYPSCRIDDWKGAPKDSKIIPEEVLLLGETNGAGDPPVAITAVTARDWTPTS